MVRFQLIQAAGPTGLVGVIAAANRGDFYEGGNRRGQDDGDYDGYDRPAPSRPRVMPQPKSQSGASLLGLFQNPKQMGALLLAVGFFLTVMGMALFFEGNLLRLGNICTIVGIPLLLGPDRVRGFFLKQSRIQATVITSIGIFLVFIGKPRLGIFCEIFGLLNLFGNMWPVLFAVAKRLPIIGDILTAVEAAATGSGGGRGRAQRREVF